MAKSIYLSSSSDLSAISKLLDQANEAELVLIVPKDSVLFRVPGAIRKLSRLTKSRGILVTIATTSAGGRRLALSSGFQVLKGKEEPVRRMGGFINSPITEGKKANRHKETQLSRLVSRVLPSAPSKTFDDSSRLVNKKNFSIAVLVSLVVLGFVFFYLPSAKITIASRSEPVARDIEIQVSVDQDETDIVSLTIPGEMIEKEIEGSGTFTPSGKRNIGKKASGFVQIYNLSKTTLILKSETTVLSIGGKQYFLAQDVGGIRPTAFIGQGDEQEVDQSSLTAPVPVVAALAGEEFNISDGSRVEITNEVFGSRPDELYAVASGNITGGSTLEVRVVTENDVLEGIERVREKVILEQADVIASETEGLVILESGVRSEILEESVSQAVGDQASEFSVAVRVKIRALAFNQDDVIEVVRGRVERLLPENKKLILGDEAELQSRFFVVDFDAGSGILTNHFESRIVYEVDISDMQKRVAGKNRDEISELLLSRSDIESVEITFSPFWVKKAPKFTGRIELVKE